MSTTFSPEDYRIEPANIQTLRCVRSVSLANFPRKVIPSDINNTTECIPQYAMKNTSNDPSREGLELQGELILEAGWNCALSTRGNAITIGAVPGAGDSVYTYQPAEIAVTAEEENILNSGEYLSGGPKCYQLAESVNGIKSSVIPVIPGDGVSISASPGQLTIRLTSPSASKECVYPECVSSLPKVKSCDS